MKKTYSIYLSNTKIGVSYLEKSDAPMGVVFGKIVFNSCKYNYSFFKQYCEQNNVTLSEDFAEDKYLSTYDIKQLNVINEEGIKILGIASHITGMDEEGYEVSIEGIPHPFYKEEFPHHRKAYDEKFKDKA